LVKRCVVCHNTKKRDAIDVSGGLALDTYEAIVRGGREHPILTGGKPEESELYKRLVDSDEERRMPLMAGALEKDQTELIRRWIDAGNPRGQASAADTPEPTSAARRVTRSLDVIVPLELKIPAGVEGLPAGGPVELVLKVGPLPVVSAIAFRNDGRLLAVGTSGEVVLWDLIDGQPAATLTGIPGPVHALAFSRDGRRLAVGSGLPARSGSVRIYTVPDGTLLREFEGHADVVYALAWRRDDAQIASAGFDQTVRVWNLADGQPGVLFKGHSDFVYDVGYAPDGRTLLSASKDRSIKRIDLASGKSLRTYSDHEQDVLALAVQPDGSGFVTAGLEPQLRWWAFDKDAPVRKVGGHSGPVHQLAFSGNGKRLISASGDKSVRIWDGSSGIFQRTLPGPTEWQYAVALSFDARLAAAGGWDGLVRIWDADAGTLRAVLIQPPGVSPGAGEWLGVSPRGYINVSPGLADLIRWRVSGAQVPRERLSSACLQPNYFARTLRGEAVDPPF
jgi:WD40 repeat protein